jgi:uncharacterized protein YllA (UPF0747 family)
MVKLNKVIIILFIGCSSLFAPNTYTFVCLCATELAQAFSDIDEHVIDDNLDPMKDALEDNNDRVEDNIEALKNNNKLLEKKVKIYTKQYMDLQELLLTIKTESHLELNSIE